MHANRMLGACSLHARSMLKRCSRHARLCASARTWARAQSSEDREKSCYVLRGIVLLQYHHLLEEGRLR